MADVPMSDSFAEQQTYAAEVGVWKDRAEKAEEVAGRLRVERDSWAQEAVDSARIGEEWQSRAIAVETARDELFRHLCAQTDMARAAEARLAEAEKAIRAVTDDTPCEFHGTKFCYEHDVADCQNAHRRAFLDSAGTD